MLNWWLLLKKLYVRNAKISEQMIVRKIKKIMVTRSSLTRPWHPSSLDITNPQLVLLKPHAYTLVHGWHLFPVLVAHHVADYSLCRGLDFLCLPRSIPFGHHPSVLRHPSSSRPSPRNAKEGKSIHVKSIQAATRKPEIKVGTTVNHSLSVSISNILL